MTEDSPLLREDSPPVCTKGATGRGCVAEITGGVVKTVREPVTEPVRMLTDVEDFVVDESDVVEADGLT